MVHQWRSEEGAILIGYNTALIDNPQLNTRLASGKNPLRIVIDNQLTLAESLHIFDNISNTIIFNSIENKKVEKTEWVKATSLQEILDFLYQRNISSLIIEGGAKTLQKCINANLWDEALVFVSDKIFMNGVKAPVVERKISTELRVGPDKLLILIN